MLLTVDRLVSFCTISQDTDFGLVIKSSNEMASLQGVFNKRFSVLLSLGVMASLLGSSSTLAANDDEFSLCVNKLQDTARQQGVSEHIIESSLAKVKFVDKVIALDGQHRGPSGRPTFDVFEA